MKRLAVIAVAVAVVGTMTGCDPKFPTDPPAIEGLITNATAGAGTVTILVEVPDDELPPPASSYSGIDKASVTVTSDTILYDTDGDPVEMWQLRRDARVRVWFAGPVAESYPVQGRASAVRLLN